MTDWNGFDKGVIGRKLPSDSTLNNMKKSELIKLLHCAEHNHKVLAEVYQIAVDNSKCNSCPLSLNSKKVREEAIDKFNNKVNYLKNSYVDACNMCTKVECSVCVISNFIEDLEWLKEKHNG